MEKGNGGEKRAEEKENVGGGGKKVEVEDGGGKKAAQPACFTKTAGEDATILDTTKDYFKQLKETSADTHWDCIKNRVRLAKEYVAEKTGSVFGRKKVQPEVKADETPDVEEGAKPAAPAPAAGGESR